MKLWARLIAWFKRTVYRQPPLPVFKPEAAPAPASEPRKVARRPRLEEDKSQAHYYLGDLLDNLDDYFHDLAYLRRGNDEMAANFERFGVVVTDRDRLLGEDFEPVFFDGEMPAQGCFYFGRNKDEAKSKWLSFRFLYFQKHKQPINVQTTNGKIYTVGGVFGMKQPHLFQIHLAVFEDRSVRVLKEAQPVFHTVGKGSRKNDTNNRHTFGRIEWGYPRWAREVVTDTNKRRNENLTIDEHFTRMFRIMTSAVAHAELDMNVRVRKDDRVATFSINMLRTPYFFADREKTVNANGNTERILHIVKPHTRTNRHGQKKLIKAHWRGVRRFTWNGYDVSIGMPGKHYMPLWNFTAEAWSEVDAERLGMKDPVELTEAAKIIDNLITAPRRTQ